MIRRKAHSTVKNKIIENPDFKNRDFFLPVWRLSANE